MPLENVKYVFSLEYFRSHEKTVFSETSLYFTVSRNSPGRSHFSSFFCIYTNIFFIFSNRNVCLDALISRMCANIIYFFFHIVDLKLTNFSNYEIFYSYIEFLLAILPPWTYRFSKSPSWVILDVVIKWMRSYFVGLKPFFKKRF